MEAISFISPAQRGQARTFPNLRLSGLSDSDNIDRRIEAAVARLEGLPESLGSRCRVFSAGAFGVSFLVLLQKLLNQIGRAAKVRLPQRRYGRGEGE